MRYELIRRHVLAALLRSPDATSRGVVGVIVDLHGPKQVPNSMEVANALGTLLRRGEVVRTGFVENRPTYRLASGPAAFLRERPYLGKPIPALD